MIGRLPVWLAALLLPAGPAIAGPPFITDDPGVLGDSEVEIIPYLDLVSARGADRVEAGVDASIGIIPGFQAGIIAPLHRFEGGQDKVSLGDIALTVKFALSDGADGGIAVALGPAIALPTASAGRDRVGLDLPIWVGIERRDWTLYGGGGYRFDAANDGKDRVFGGIVAEYGLADLFRLGGEVFVESGNSRSPSLVMSGLGGRWTIAHSVSLVAAGHAILVNRRANGRFHAYTSLVITP